ncbi:MAG: group 1 truncated hemoglobin [Planctomycetaceae bacterium]|jgi:hemoglobin|nr:group 1 truncated hemoglobin [Planctomycetaceae bacterium]
MNATLYERLGGYDAVAAVADALLQRLRADSQLGRFWENRGDDGIAREKQLLIDFLCASAGGPLLYTGRDMVTSHRGMGITTGDWDVFISHLEATLRQFELPEVEFAQVIDFIQGTQDEIIDP